MRKKIVAKRYAKSLVELAQEMGKVEKLFADMTGLQETSEYVPHFIDALSDERIPLGKRIDAVNRICKELGLWKCTCDTLLLLMKKNRIDLLPEIAPGVLNLIRLHKKMALACAQVADQTIAADVKTRVEQILTKLLGLSVQCEVSIDSSLFGGFALQVGDMKFDASIKGKLTRMKEEFFQWK